MQAYITNALDYLLEEYLQYTVRASVLAAELSRLLDQVLILRGELVLLRSDPRGAGSDLLVVCR